MSHARLPSTRSLLLALLGALLLFGGLDVERAGAAEPVYGGLGRVGASIIKPGEGGGHGQVNPFTNHNFAVDSNTGDFFIADEFVEAGHNLARVQEFGSKGEFLAENRVKLGTSTGSSLGGLAVDAELKRVYMLEVRVRPEESEKIEEQISKKEEQISKKEELIKEKEAKHEEVTKLKEEVAKLKKEVAELEEEKPVFDPGLNAASQIYSFSTEASGEQLKGQKVLTASTVLTPTSEVEKVSLIDPSGIAVDPKSHDIVLLGQQDESTHKGSGEEELRAAVQRVHEDGSLGPRYVDQENCLDQGEPSAEEPACAKKPRAEFPRSPIVTPSGKVYVGVTQAAGEIWEIPATEGAKEGFKDLAVHPKRVFTLDDEKNEREKVVEFHGEEEGADMMSFVAGPKPNEGRIFVDAKIEGAGVVVLNYVENGESTEVTERGWTGGQSQVSTQQKCAIPVPNRAILLGAGSGERVLVLDTRPEREETPALVDVLEFGPGGEGCGTVTVTPPSVEFGEKKNATEVPVGQSATLSSRVVGANAKHTRWKFKFNEKEEEPGPFESGYQFEATSLSHVFGHVGKYEITEIVETDNLGSPIKEEHLEKSLTVTGSPPTVKIGPVAPVRAGESVGFEAKVTDPNEAKPHLTYTWNFGDGTAPVKEEEEATEATVVRKTKHTFHSRCATSCVVTLTVEDASGESRTVKAEVLVGEGKEEEEARAKAEKEMHEREARERAEREAHEREARERAEKEAHEREAHERAEKEKQEVLGSHTFENPEARLASASLGVSTNGALTLKVTCPTGETICAGTVTLRTLTAVSARAKKAILTLASGAFSVTGGQAKTVTLHLSAKARKLVASSHVLRALATLVAHDSTGVTRTTKATVTLRLAKPSHGHK